jgi:uncharacterized protein
LTVLNGAANKMATRKKSEKKLLKCPTCGAVVGPQDEDFPFCSDRCRKIDLGKWAMGVYKISSPVLDPEVLEDLGGSGTRRDEGSE